MESNPTPAQPAPQATAQPVETQQTVPPTATPVNPNPQPQNVVTDQKAGGSKKMLWIIIALVSLVILAGGYFMMTRSTPAPVTPPVSTTSTEGLDSLATDLNSIDTDSTDLDSDFSALDKDLSELQ